MFLNPVYLLRPLILCLPCLVFSQSLENPFVEYKTYKELKTLFYDNVENDSLGMFYADLHLQKAKKEYNILKMADSYLYKSYVSEFENSIKFSDSIIYLTKNLSNYYYPALGYMIKGYYLYNADKENDALDLYLKAYNYAVVNKNEDQQIEIKQFIGGIKYNFGDFDEAIVIFKEQLEFIKSRSNYKNDFYEDYIIVLDDLSKTYLRGDMPDSSLFYVKEGIKNSLNNDDQEMYHRFLLTSGSAYFKLKDFDRAIDSLNKLEPRVVDSTRLAMCLYYRGKSFQSKNQNHLAIKDFKRIDTIYQKTSTTFIELRDVYQNLFNYYAKEGSTIEQLENIKRFIKIDSIFKNDFKYANTKILIDYDVPTLKEEKRNLEQQIISSKRKIGWYIIIFIVSLLVILIISIKFYLNQRTYKRRYNNIINSVQNNATLPVLTKDTSISIPDNVIEDIKKKLDVFEYKLEFLDSRVNLNSLSKKLGTNSTYLSKIINNEKGMSLSNYLNQLRIEFAVRELKKNTTVRNYTINAIANEMGFNTAESFSKAFFKEKGIYPSYYIKKLNSEN